MKFSKHPFRFIIIACLCVQSAFLFALDVPPLNGPVNDYAHIFTASETQELNAYLYSIDRQSDLQIAVLTIPSLEGESLEDYSIRVAEKWQIGQKGKDSGVILVIAAQDRKLRIEVGYGLEDRITDAQSSRIIRSVIAPQFKKREYGKGVLLGVKNLVGLALQDESLISDAVKESDRQNDDSIPLPLVIFLIIIFFYIFKIHLIIIIICYYIYIFFWFFYIIFSNKSNCFYLIFLYISEHLSFLSFL